MPRFVTATRAGGALVVLIFVAAATLMATKKPSGVNTGTPATPIGSMAAPALANAGDTTIAPVTITGCLEERDSALRLKNAEGDDVPKSRSWKSGFLKKSSTPIAVVEASSRLKLSSHVGERISVTGVLVDRAMKVRSLQTVAAACR